MALTSMVMLAPGTFGACTIGGIINVWNENFEPVSITDLKIECTAIVYYEAQTEIGTFPLLVCGTRFPEELGEKKFGLFITGAGFQQKLPVTAHLIY